jgi:predicted dehydrogenase
MIGGRLKLMSVLRIGVVGCGRVTKDLHLPALRRLPEVGVGALADVDPERLEAVATQFGIAHRHTDYRALLDDPSIEAVAVCVPAQFHTEVALAALDAGKHILVEKPLALSLEDCTRVAERSTQAGRKAAMGLNLRFHPFVQHAREMIMGGSLGSVDSMRTVWTSGYQFRATTPAWRTSRATGGGALLEIGIHHFDLWRYVLQSEVTEVFAVERVDAAAEVTVLVTAKMANGVMVSSLMSDRTSDSNELEIFGEAGRLRADLYRFDGLESYPSTGYAAGLRARLGQIVAQLPENLLRLPWAMREGGIFRASYLAEWQHFVDAIRRDTPLTCTLEDGRRALQVALSIMQSAATGNAVRVADAPSHIIPASSTA